MANFNLNKVILGGRLTAKPELKTTPFGSVVTSFTIAVQRGKDNVDFISCNAWKQTAELVAQYFGKGSSICIEGNIQTRTFESNGQKRYVTEVLATSVHFVDSKSESPCTPDPSATKANFVEVAENEELPF